MEIRKKKKKKKKIKDDALNKDCKNELLFFF